MNKKIAIVTGGTSGVGLSIVKALVKEFHEVNFIGTNDIVGTKIEKELQSEFIDTIIRFHNVDLSNIKNTRNFILSFQRSHEKLDLLANIAGVLFSTRQESPEGIEKTFAISYLSAFYISNELLPLLKKASNSRIINVGASPAVVLRPQLNFSDLNSKDKYSAFKASTRAVHAKTVLTQTLANKLIDTNVSVISFHPGTIRSGLFRNMPFFSKLLMGLLAPFFKKDSKTGIKVCVDCSFHNISGQLVTDKKIVKLNYTPDYQQRLWDESERMVKRAIINGA